MNIYVVDSFEKNDHGRYEGPKAFHDEDDAIAYAEGIAEHAAHVCNGEWTYADNGYTISYYLEWENDGTHWRKLCVLYRAELQD